MRRYVSVKKARNASKVHECRKWDCRKDTPVLCLLTAAFASLFFHSYLLSFVAMYWNDMYDNVVLYWWDYVLLATYMTLVQICIYGSITIAEEYKQKKHSISKPNKYWSVILLRAVVSCMLAVMTVWCSLGVTIALVGYLYWYDIIATYILNSVFASGSVAQFLHNLFEVLQIGTRSTTKSELAMYIFECHLNKNLILLYNYGMSQDPILDSLLKEIDFFFRSIYNPTKSYPIEKRANASPLQRLFGRTKAFLLGIVLAYLIYAAYFCIRFYFINPAQFVQFPTNNWYQSYISGFVIVNIICHCTFVCILLWILLQSLLFQYTPKLQYIDYRTRLLLESFGELYFE
ncbi:hypothetical protein RFI_02045 [Reticulomyxa filosa]|uniref:Uncharacterized protein n=1 Tax=Reticulomyxa filosa TaxID=46433 RepID=X6PAE2_RETFI|nr:hypothetical protein RFI_02045 [Reticulomyxa filosa]|eukprot:ETO35029.1 hypothetical protein RFI_02045 [Reticulomyxa filosa]